MNVLKTLLKVTLALVLVVAKRQIHVGGPVRHSTHDESDQS